MSKLAVIETGGKQYRVQENDIIKIEKLPVQEGDTVTFDKVLLVGDEAGTDVQVGTPFVDTKVEGKVLRQARSKKVNVVKYKPKIRYKKVTGHRQHFTEVQITKIG
jgi:large subunit ribosomal protein L21